MVKRMSGAGTAMAATLTKRARKDLTFIGPNVNRAARILKQTPPMGITAMARVFASARRTNPALKTRFAAPQEFDLLRGFDDGGTLFPPAREEANHHD
jgi:class 3 adenylate cyclase